MKKLLKNILRIITVILIIHLIRKMKKFAEEINQDTISDLGRKGAHRFVGGAPADSGGRLQTTDLGVATDSGGWEQIRGWTQNRVPRKVKRLRVAVLLQVL